MSEKDIKTKPKTTTKAVQNTPKVAESGYAGKISGYG